MGNAVIGFEFFSAPPQCPMTITDAAVVIELRGGG